MLIPALIATFLALPPDSVSATLVIRASTPESLPVEWLVIDSNNALIDQGRTPSELPRILSAVTQTVCAAQPNVRLSVSLLVPDKGTEINGTGRCFLFGIVKGRVSLHGVFDPRATSDKP